MDLHLSDFQLIGNFIISVFSDIGVLIFNTILFWVFVLFIFKLCVKTIKKIIG